MKIKSIHRQHRRDFYATYECEHCGHTVKATGYDDDNFHQNVIPQMLCGQCGKSAGDDYVAWTPKYPSHLIV